LLVLAGLSSSAGLLSACEDGPGAKAPGRPVAPYTGHLTELFDDAIDPAAVGLDMDNSYHPRSDAALRERSQVSDAILRVKITTLTNKIEEGANGGYEIGVKQLEWIGGDHPPGTDQFTIRMRNTTQNSGIMKTMEGRMVGTEFIVFLRQFAGGDGEDKQFHAHFAPATKDVKDAVGDAIVLRELK
jgi:hypothetical protein